MSTVKCSNCKISCIYHFMYFGIPQTCISTSFSVRGGDVTPCPAPGSAPVTLHLTFLVAAHSLHHPNTSTQLHGPPCNVLLILS